VRIADLPPRHACTANTATAAADTAAAAIAAATAAAATSLRDCAALVQVCIKRSPINGRCEKYSEETVLLDPTSGGSHTKLEKIAPRVAAVEEESDLVKRLKQQ
jgi:hypothetical protein